MHDVPAAIGQAVGQADSEVQVEVQGGRVGVPLKSTRGNSIGDICL